MTNSTSKFLFRSFIAILWAVFSATYAGAEDYTGSRYLDNGEIKIGINLDLGGAITYLSKSGSNENMINSHDWGRQIQMSFYSGPVPFEPNGRKAAPEWSLLGWNPIQAGDCYRNRSKVLALKHTKGSLYVKCIPMHWPHDNVPGESTFETWISLEGNTAVVRSKINNHRDDKTQYAGRSQELPAVYTNGTHYRLFTYTGNAPYTGGDLHQVTKVWDMNVSDIGVAGGPWDHWYATENWSALVNDDNQGVGIWSPGTFTFSGGFAGVPGAGGPEDSPTGYISPVRREIIDHNIEYAYDYVLIVGSLDEIRSHVYSNAQREQLPDYDFAKDRQGWTHRDCEDTGWPHEDKWRVQLTGKDAKLVGPYTFWDAARMPKLYLRAAFDTGKNQAVLRIAHFGKRGKGRIDELPFDIVSDGNMRDYVIDLTSLETYRGPCTQLSLLPLADAAEHRTVEIESISHQAP